MTPESTEDRHEAEIKGLIKSYGALERDQVRHDERIDAQAKAQASLRDDMREMAARGERLLAETAKACQEHTNAALAAIAAQGKQSEARAVELEKQLGEIDRRRQWTPMAIGGFLAAILGPAALIAQALLGGG